jgi:lipoprotein-releasing system permease protein
MIGLSSYHIRVYPPADAALSADELYKEAERFTGFTGITGAFPEKQGIALAAGKNGRLGVTLRAVPRNLFADNSDFSALFTVLEGSGTFASGESAHPEGNLRSQLFARRSVPFLPAALIGSKIASDLDVHPGDTIQVISIRTNAAGIPLPRAASFKVSGVISSGYQELDALWVFIPIEESDRILAGSSIQGFVGLVTENPFSRDFPVIVKNIEQSLDSDYIVYGWKDFNSSQYENFASTRIMLLFIMILIVLVASVNISSALFILAIERRREIAILKSLGSSSGGISFSFLLTGLYAGICGVVIGVPLGILCAVNVNGIISFMEKVVNIAAKLLYIIGNPAGENFFTPVHLLDPAYYLEKIPIILPFGQLVFIVCGTLVLSVFAAVFPSIRAGREKPIHTLRKI